MTFDASILIPARNERDSIEECVRRTVRAVGESCEILVIDGGSTDGTEQVVRRLANEYPFVRYLANPADRGKGHAIRTGVSEARADVMAQLDADLQFRPEDLRLMIDPIQKGLADVVLGSRFTRGAHREPGATPVLRTVGNHLVSAYASLVAGRRFTDVQAGLKAWSRDAIHRIDLESDGFSYEAEIAVKAARLGLRVLEVPVHTDPRRHGQSHVSVWRAGLALVRDITRYAWKTHRKHGGCT